MVGRGGLDLLEPYLRADSLATAEAAARALACNVSTEARALLRRELRRRVDEAWWSLLAIRVLPYVILPVEVRP